MRSLLAALLVTSSATAADWPQFLGPKRDNTTTEKVAAWTGEPKVLWKQPVGEAHASPVVADGVVYAFYQPKGKNADALAAYDAKTGEQKWEKSYDREPLDLLFGNGPRGTPAVAGGQVFTLGSTGVLAAWDAKTGEVQWKVDTLKKFQAENLFFGISGSPLVADGKVFVNVGGKGAGVVAFDCKTGEVAWKATDDNASYSSPIAVGTGKAAEVVFLTKQYLRGLAVADGAELWKVPFADRSSESATTPLVVGESLVASSVTRGAELFKLTLGEKPGVTSEWKKPKLNCYFSTPVAVGDDLYMLNGVLSITPSITLRCVEAKTGTVRWEKKGVGGYHAALVLTGDGKLLMLDDKGGLTLFQPDAKEYKELAKSKVCGPTWAHPALVNGVVYLRDEKQLFAIELPAGK
ncbi:outer membrane protein assembly factor BamB family protein [Limnoglobus roseus]|uniref:Alcohol dehydrogenase n=1 Tax=Limnoglobus roseus TaxID=2598579 RepID=A0A5C1A9N0_9BACT|nr:PQQ-binding-like beta-propeller repeat protein [Limnoglobus roseus]QEL15911.1 alcohol dehydrogenase [Limnoglobus roseus]